ncbi:MAG: ABC transporter ATP-binding protein [Clostridia bacterium]|nr:ABC transporter ATP-binding protein [Clostridia bacterium]
MLTAIDLTRTYEMDGQTVAALSDVSFHIGQGEYAAIVGPSGSGKSTLMHLLGCLDRPSAGQYLLDGQDISQLPDKCLAQLRGEKIGFVFQGFQLIPRMTALENVLLPMILCGMKEKERTARAEALLGRVGLGDRLHHRPSQLSGGQQQRVAIARALAREPAVLLADEPTGALDPQSTREVLSLLDELHQEGHTVLLITHDMAVARRAQRQLVIRGGQLVSDSVAEIDIFSTQM